MTKKKIYHIPVDLLVPPDGPKSAIPREYVDAHAGNADNPHGVTAEQVGAYTEEQTDERIAAAMDQKADAVDMAEHVDDLDNPHEVTCEQIGAASTRLASPDNPGLMSQSDKVKLDGISSADLLKSYVITITGDGETTEWTLTHNIGTPNVIVQAFNADGDTAIFNVARPSGNQVVLGAEEAPENGTSFTIYIMGTGV